MLHRSPFPMDYAPLSGREVHKHLSASANRHGLLLHLSCRLYYSLYHNMSFAWSFPAELLSMQLFPFHISLVGCSCQVWDFTFVLIELPPFFNFPHPLLFLQLVMNILNSNPSPQRIYSPSSLVSAVNLISLLFVPSSKSLTEGLNKTKSQTNFCTQGRLSSPLGTDWFLDWVQISHRLCTCFIGV